MRCPVCRAPKTRSVDRRYRGGRFNRRRECRNGHRFNTVEITETEFDIIAGLFEWLVATRDYLKAERVEEDT